MKTISNNLLHCSSINTSLFSAHHSSVGGGGGLGGKREMKGEEIATPGVHSTFKIF